MKYNSAFEIIGPVMIGPSSSHTAGAVRIGNVARQVLGEPPTEADFLLTGSFAETYRGHGTDLALIAGCNGLTTEDLQVPDAEAVAARAGLKYVFRTGHLGFHHPNTVAVTLRGEHRQVSLIASSLGGGKIEIVELDGLPIHFSGEWPTLLLFHEDKKGFLAKVSYTLDAYGYNIARLNLERWSRSGMAITVAEVDSDIQPDLPSALLHGIPPLRDVRVVRAV